MKCIKTPRGTCAIQRQASPPRRAEMADGVVTVCSRTEHVISLREAEVTCSDCLRLLLKSAVHNIRVADMVTFDYGGGLMVTGTVVEDRGEIGVEGRRLLRVCVDMGPDVDAMFIELPAEALTSKT